METDQLLLHAPNVHHGGGRALLMTLVSSLGPEVRGELILDQRLQPHPPTPPGMTARRVAPTLLQRFQAEVHLARAAGPDSRVLCFGNLPPLFRCRGRVAVFVHSRHLVDDTDLSGFPLRHRLRLRAERLWLRGRRTHADEWIVQTESMRALLLDFLGGRGLVRVLPLVPPDLLTRPEPPASSRQATFDFCYVASGEPHKNHKALVAAWTLLAREGVVPSLCLTLDTGEFAELCRWIESQAREYGLRIENLGAMPRQRIGDVYARSRCLIYPSWCESFGLPLLEAKGHRLAVVAAELDYVRDLITPDETFDPSSPRSIARAVRRFLGGDPARAPLVDGRQFLEQLFAA